MEYLLDYPDVGFSGNIYEAENDRTYSLNTMPLEYAGSGVGDFRVPAVTVRHADGSQALDLRFQKYFIRKGKYSIPGLPAVYAEENEAETLEILMKDTASETEVHLFYGVLEEADVITRSVMIINRGSMPIVLERAHSLCMDIPDGNWDWIHFHGRHTMERQAERTSLFYGIQESSSTRGTSSHQQNPSILLCERDCTEKDWGVYGSGTDVQWWFPDTDRERSAWADTTCNGNSPGYFFHGNWNPEQNFLDARSNLILFGKWNGGIVTEVSSCHTPQCM